MPPKLSVKLKEASLVQSPSKIIVKIKEKPEISEASPAPRHVNFKGNLYDFQEVFLTWAQDKHRLIPDIEMGLGKTPIFIRRVCLKQYRRTLIIVPLPILKQWLKEWQKFTDIQANEIISYHGSGRDKLDLEPYRVILTNYDSVRIDMEDPDSPLSRLIGQFDMVCLDEAHVIRNKATRIHIACCQVSFGCKDKWAMTGTVIHNKFEDFSGLCNFLEIYGTRFYTKPHIDAFKERHYYHLTKVQAHMSLPKFEHDHYLEFDEHHAMEYNEVWAEVKEIYKKYIQAPTQLNFSCLLAKITRLRQGCNHPNAMLSQEDREVDSNLYRYKDSAKFQLIADQAKDYPQDKMLIFSQWTVSLDLLASYLDERGITYMKYNGSFTLSQKEAAVEDFKTNSVQLLLMTITSGGVGLNLTCANHVFIMDSWWNGALEDQAYNRIYRIGQVKKVYIHRMYMTDTIETWVKELKKEKKIVSKQFTDYNTPSSTNKDMLTELLRQYI